MYPQKLKTHTIFFIRHGQTDWNVARRKQGQTNVPLNDLGRQQAVRNGKILKEVIGNRLDQFLFVASPLIRCRETMEIVRDQLELPLRDYTTDRRLMEIDYGNWQGSTTKELRRVDQQMVEDYYSDQWNFNTHGGESYSQLSHRALEWLFQTQYNTVVVGHRGINRCLQGYIEEVDQPVIPSLEVPQDKIMQIEGAHINWL